MRPKAQASPRQVGGRREVYLDHIRPLRSKGGDLKLSKFALTLGECDLHRLPAFRGIWLRDGRHAMRQTSSAVMLICAVAISGCSPAPKIAELPLEADPQAVAEFKKLVAEIQQRSQKPIRRLARSPEGFWVRTETKFEVPEGEIVESDPLSGNIKVSGHITTWLKNKPKPNGTFDPRDKRFASEAAAMDARANVVTPPPIESAMTYEWDGEKWVSEEGEAEYPFGDREPDDQAHGLTGWAIKPW
jgi:hypothetical protein